MIIDSTRDQFHEEQQQIIQSLRKSSGTHKIQELEAEREKLKMKHLQIIENITTFEQLEAFKRITAPLETTMLAIAESGNGTPTNLLAPTTSKHTTNSPHNKNINKQRRLFSTKKKTRKLNEKLNLPTSHETDVTAIQLLNIQV